jgi:transcriptional regulator with XRE-family HTH domain
MAITNALHIGMIWRLRRIAVGLRQQDVAARAGITTTRLSAIERGEQKPSDLDRKIIERVLPDLPVTLGAGDGKVGSMEIT